MIKGSLKVKTGDIVTILYCIVEAFQDEYYGKPFKRYHQTTVKIKKSVKLNVALTIDKQKVIYINVNGRCVFEGTVPKLILKKRIININDGWD